MKYLSVKTTLYDFFGKEMSDNTKSGKDKILRIQDILGLYVGKFFQSKDPKKIVLAYAVAQKIYGTKIDKLALEDAELDLIEEAMGDPSTITCPVCRRQAHGPVILGPIYQAIEEAKTAKKETVKKEIAPTEE